MVTDNGTELRTVFICYSYMYIVIASSGSYYYTNVHKYRIERTVTRTLYT